MGNEGFRRLLVGHGKRHGVEIDVAKAVIGSSELKHFVGDHFGHVGGAIDVSTADRLLIGEKGRDQETDSRARGCDSKRSLRVRSGQILGDDGLNDQAHGENGRQQTDSFHVNPPGPALSNNEA